MTKIVTAVGGVVVMFGLRAMQITMTVPHTTGWWVLEALRWGVVLSLLLVLVAELNRMARDIRDHRERLAAIENEAIWARIELDVKEIREYAETV